MKKGLIFNPYLDTLGGGEFYSLAVGEFLIKKNFSLEIAWPKEDILEKINQRFGVNFENRIKINSKAFLILKQKRNLLKKYLFTKKYQLIFFISNGNIPFLFAKKNFIHFQIPFINIGGKNFINQLKLKKINKIICNSLFTKQFIDEEYNVNSTVIYPPLSDKFLKPTNITKENIILSVGRFDQILNAKKQDILIKVFKEMVDKGLKKWQLVLLGGLKEKNNYFNKLRHLSFGYPIKILANVDFDKLFETYQKAKIYWHAAGFDQDLEDHPERGEHFGISVVEAMANGCVPVVFNGGGIPEIVTHQDNGFLWNIPEELEKITIKLINDKDKLREFTKKAKIRSQYFSKKSFEDNLERIFFNNEKNN